jgi:hypothetical protein
MFFSPIVSFRHEIHNFRPVLFLFPVLVLFIVTRYLTDSCALSRHQTILSGIYLGVGGRSVDAPIFPFRFFADCAMERYPSQPGCFKNVSFSF